MSIVEERTPVEVEQLDELEELWRAEAAPEPQQAETRDPERILRLLRRTLAWGWVVFLVLVTTFEPAPEPGVKTPGWAAACAASMFLVLAGAALAGKLGRLRLAAGGSAYAAGIGALLAFECRASGHHTGSFWLYELGPTLALLALSVYVFDRTAAAGHDGPRGRGASRRP